MVLRLVINFMMVMVISTSIFAEPLPEYIFKHPVISADSSDEVHELVKSAAAQVYPDPKQARVLLLKALAAVSQGEDIDQYDYLWTQYGLLRSSFETDTSDFLPGVTVDEYMKVARTVLAYLDTQSVGGKGYTELEAFKMEVYRSAGNGLAWNLMEKEVLDEALQIITKTKEFIRDNDDYYIYDTEVRILLKMGKTGDAYSIVEEVLAEDSSFGDFQDIKGSAAYNAWLKQKATD